MCLILKNSTPQDPAKRQQLVEAAKAMIHHPDTESFIDSFAESLDEFWSDPFVESSVTWVIFCSGLHKSKDPIDHYTLQGFLPDGEAVLTAHVYSPSQHAIFEDGGKKYGAWGLKRLSFSRDCDWLG